MSVTRSEQVLTLPLREQMDGFLDAHRAGLAAALEGLSDHQARARLVPSPTTLLGLVKHATFVERVWFGEALFGWSRTEMGVAATPAESFVLHGDDTIASVTDGLARRVAIKFRPSVDRSFPTCARPPRG